MKKVYIDKLPKINKTTKINWKNCIGYKIRFIYDDIEGWVEIIDYIQKNQNLYIKYNEEIFNIKTGHFKSCKLGNIIGKINRGYLYNINDNIIDKKRNLTIINQTRIKSDKAYVCKCNICGWDNWNILESNLKKGNSCPCCCNIKTVQGINDIATVASWMIPYIGEECAKNNVPNSSSKKVDTICPNCKNKKKMFLSNLYKRGFSCSKCGDGISMPNKTMINVLEQLKIEFINEYSPNWIGRKRFDFYIPSINVIIEMDGGWHNKDNNMSGQTKEESKTMDDYKDEQAKLHGIEVIRIDCDYKYYNRFEYVKNSLLTNNRLNKLFDLSKINWIKVESFTLTNLLYDTCTIKRNNPELNITEISKIVCLSIPTVINYLKTGDKLNLCTYIPYEGSIRFLKSIQKELSEKQKKPLEMFKDNISLGVFNCADELENKSEKLFGIELKSGGIRSVCNGSRKSYKGYKFVYLINKEETIS